ncbi:hypothetical protein PF006_g31705, partial [Phytophthora fragariae]
DYGYYTFPTLVEKVVGTTDKLVVVAQSPCACSQTLCALGGGGYG